MTAEKRQRYYTKHTSAYLSGYDGNAVRQLEQLEEFPVHRQRTHRNKREVKRLELEVREPGKIAPFAVVGLLAVCLLTILMLSQYASLVGVNDTAVGLKKDLETLKTEEAKLLTQYELAYDLQAIEQDLLASGEMIKPQNSQVQMIELTEPDSVEYYQNAGFGNGIVTGIKEIFSTIRTYF
ncbi:MAG: hypothetical protein K0S60_378 [Evtepia sp.]|nr:hypothetical protein [Evtepia sp.]